MAGRRRYDWLALGEALSVAGLIGSYIWWVRPHWSWPAALIFAPMFLSHLRRGDTLRRLGFGWKNFRNAFVPVILPTLAGCALLFAAAHAFGIVRHVPPRRQAGDLVAYLFWGLAQQYVLNGFFVNRLCDFYGAGNQLGVCARENKAAASTATEPGSAPPLKKPGALSRGWAAEVSRRVWPRAAGWP